MVKVVSTTPHPSVVKETVCRNCGSTLEYVPADVKKRATRDYTGSTDIDHYITCPTCSHDCYVKGY